MGKYIKSLILWVYLFVILLTGCVGVPSLGKVQEVADFSGHTGNVLSVAFSPDDATLISAGADQTLILRESTSGRIIKQVKAHADTIYSVAFSPDGQKIVSTSADKTVKVWDAATLELLKVLTGNRKSVFCAIFSPDNKQIASGSKDLTIRLWDAQSYEPLNIFTGHGGSVQSLLYTPGGDELISCGDDKLVKRWDVQTGLEIENYKQFKHKVLICRFFDADTLISGTGFGDIYLVNIESGKTLTKFEAHTVRSDDNVNFYRIWGLAVGSGFFISSAEDKKIKFWSSSTKNLLKTLSPRTKVWCLELDSTGTLLAAGTSNGQILMYRIGDQL